MSSKLKDFISFLRTCKTQKEEKEFMLKEKSRIQESFLKNKHELRPRNLVKLLFINLQGFDTEFGQIESLNIINRSSFLEKKIGYLTLSLFIHEKSEMLMMATNRLGLDLDSPHLFVKALALNCFASIADADMCRSLSPKIVKLSQGEFPRPKTRNQFISRAFSLSRNNQRATDFLRGKNADDLRVLNVKKKAILAALRICQKCPELRSDYYKTVRLAIQEEEHGVILSALPLIREIVLGIIQSIKEKHIKPENLMFFGKILNNLTQRVQALVRETDPEYEIGKLNDPFLIVGMFSLIKDCVTNILCLVNPPSGKNLDIFISCKSFISLLIFLVMMRTFV
jgi:AP-1 complex subunit gamma-1